MFLVLVRLGIPCTAVCSGSIVLSVISPRIERTRVAPDRLLKLPEAASRLACSPGTVENLVRRGLLEKVPVLGAVRYRESDIQRIIREGAVSRVEAA
jgi:hypothetical protein